jgi:cell division septum initiation protein DivIVA
LAGASIPTKFGRAVPAGGWVDEGELFDCAEWFDTAWRGYHHGQVERRMEELLGSAERDRRDAEAAARQLEAARAQLREAVAAGGSAGQGSHGGRAGYGARVEQLIENAELEAGRLRETASREAAELLVRAEQEVEALRRRIEGEVDRREVELAEQLDQRAAGLDLREREAEQVLVTARADAERISEAAACDAHAQLAEAARRAEELSQAAQQEAAPVHIALRAELERLARLRDLVAEQIEQLDPHTGDHLSVPVGGGADGDPEGDREGAGPDAPGSA